MKQTVITRRDVLGVAAAFATWGVPSIGRELPEISTKAIDVRKFGTAGDGRTNDTRAIEGALRAAPTIFVPAGVYLIDQLMLPTGTTILTDGFATIFKQQPRLPPTVRILNVVGSNVAIGDCTVEGNIESDTGEQHHGINVSANKQTADISHVRIGNVRGSNLRGDVVYLGTADGRNLHDVEVGDVFGSNVLRNVVSIVGGDVIRIGTIGGSRVGYMHLDIEPDRDNGPVTYCTVKAVHGGFVQVAGQTAEAYVEAVALGLVDLEAPVNGSTPVYLPGLNRADALTIRNVRSIEFGQFLAKDFPGHAIKQVWDPGELTDQRIDISEAHLINCCTEHGAAFIAGSPRATRLKIDDLEIDIRKRGVDAIRDCKEAKIGHVQRKMPKGSRLVARSPSLAEPLLYAAGGASLAAGLYRMVRWYRTGS
jgi:hypothetical protein